MESIGREHCLSQGGTLTTHAVPCTHEFTDHRMTVSVEHRSQDELAFFLVQLQLFAHWRLFAASSGRAFDDDLNTHGRDRRFGACSSCGATWAMAFPRDVAQPLRLDSH